MPDSTEQSSGCQSEESKNVGLSAEVVEWQDRGEEKRTAGKEEKRKEVRGSSAGRS